MAAVVTEFTHRSHAHVIRENFLEPYYFNGRLTDPGGDMPLASLRELLPGLRKLDEKGLKITRFKGLGEMNADELGTTTMDPKTRTLLQITMPDAVADDEIFRILMGEQVEPRRQSIEKHCSASRNWMSD